MKIYVDLVSLEELLGALPSLSCGVFGSIGLARGGGQRGCEGRQSCAGCGCGPASGQGLVALAYRLLHGSFRS